MARPTFLTFTEAVLAWGWVLLSLAMGACVLYVVISEGAGDLVVLIALAVLFVSMLTVGVRNVSGTWTAVRACLRVTPNGVELDRRGQQRYAWTEIAGFHVAKQPPDEYGFSVRPTMHLRDGRRVQLPGLELELGGEGPYARWKVAKISKHVATLNRLREEDAMRD